MDKTKNDTFSMVEFDEIAPVQGGFVRLTIDGWPRGAPLGIIEFTVFGKPLTTTAQ